MTTKIMLILSLVFLVGCASLTAEQIENSRMEQQSIDAVNFKAKAQKICSDRESEVSYTIISYRLGLKFKAVCVDGYEIIEQRR